MADTTTAALREMTKGDWSRLDAVLNGIASHIDFWHHGLLLTRAQIGIASLRTRLATAETALADRDRHFLWDDRLRMEREIGDLATRLATTEAERDRLLRFVTEGNALIARSSETRAHGWVTVYRMPWSRSWFDTPEAAVADWLRAPSTGTTPP